MSEKILVTGTSVRDELLKPLSSAGYVISNPTHVLTEKELADALSDSTGYLFGGDEFASATALASAKKLKVIAFLGMGYQSFMDVAAAKENGIAITNTPGTLSNAVAELTIGLLLSATRKLYLYATEYARGQTGKEEKQRDLANLRVGIVGLGGVGTRIAEMLRGGFGCSVTYFSRTRKAGEEKRLGISYAPLDQLCSVVDALIVMTPGNDQTKGLVGKSQIEKLKAGAVLINTARPEIVDAACLLAALKSGSLGYAAFDGFYEEPTAPVSEIKQFIPARLLITGHIGSLTHDARDAMANKAVKSILNILKTGSDENRVA
jgi:glyoxylate reductase